MKLIRFVVCLILFTLTRTESEESEEKSEEKSYTPEHATELAIIDTLEGHCVESICSNFHYDNPMRVASFQLKIKEQIRLLGDNKYERVQLESLVFKNSTFAHFPLNLFYAINVQEVDIRSCAIQIVTWENFIMAEELQILLLSRNKLKAITEFTFGQAPKLQYLFLDENELSELVGDSFKGLNELYFLDLSYNQLKELPGLIFAHLPALQELNLANNRLRYLPHEIFTRNTRLRNVILRGNELRVLDDNVFKFQPKLLFLDLSHNTRLGQLILNVQAEYLVAANCSLALVNLYGRVENADLRDNQIVELYFANSEALEKLVLRNNALQQIASLARATNLHELDLADNPTLVYLPDPWSVNSLERLDLSNTSLTVLPITNLAEQSQLHMLNVTSNNLREINPTNFKYLKHLTHFDISANDWNCYNLRLLMDFLIKPKGIIYKRDDFDSDFPGEYIGGIACMYRSENPDGSDEQTTPQNIFAEQMSLATNEYPTDGNTENDQLKREIVELRKELKAIVSFYEAKFDVVFGQMEDLSERIQSFENMKAALFQHVTIKT